MDLDKYLDFFRRRQRAWRLTFSRTSPAAQMVLAELQERCFANRTTMTPGADALQIARNEGKREIWLLIQRALNLTPEEQLALAQQQKEFLKP